MKKFNIQGVEDAVNKIEEYATIRGDSLASGDYKTYNKYYPYISKCINYLYEHQQLQALNSLLSHDNFNVRFIAAVYLLPVKEKECEAVLMEIANGNYGTQGFNAEWTLKLWRSGELTFPYQTKSNGGKKAEVHEHEAGDRNGSRVDTAEVGTIEEKAENQTSDTIAESENGTGTFGWKFLARLFSCEYWGEGDISNEERGRYISGNAKTQQVEFRINTFVNPYRQDIESVYAGRVERLKALEKNGFTLTKIDSPSKLGFMRVELTIPPQEAELERMELIKDVMDAIYEEEKPYRQNVCFKVRYKRGISYFEDFWWCPNRAVVRTWRGLERVDYSDEQKFDEDMWDLVRGEFDELEHQRSFALITPDEFQSIWEQATYDYQPKPF